ncbi:GCN5-related N-acetyltransferase [Pseudodesulfovibrio profundus]|uniref:GCN5-related N-acetyltransferase n=1 Tax=Pseudodesulfovibrio profundus TaxID=57320 RepID=A0A2C8F859_9BACT|nr:GNAT family N-acetyltransferase [Pseudodesulfovibrio profundus]MBC16203.1 GNAT family N-acetyltransferase [Desulfovibrio sp.]MBC17316.1 GNAT family N-acetyltransferase [Desulfovibrio sp.]SOB58587.1 GCN5-related N-acetyltransferase [Pseudodesulfovibrio profundus]|tara:strand:+ start:15193 stop:16059 length:867 start_codon:yes stop_codon:yes gene_type:complete
MTATAKLRRVKPGDIDAICDLLHTHMNPEFSVERWRRLFEPQWCIDNPDMGIVAVDGDRIVGFHGHVCSHRTVGTRQERFVNFSSWYILKEYRGQGLGRKMLEMAISDPNTTYVVCSLSPKRIDYFKTLGMDVLDTERLLWRKEGHEYENLELINDPEVIAMRANPDEVIVLNDHEGLPITPLLVSTKCTQCLLLLSVAKKKGGRVYYDVLYRSNPGLFTDRAPDIAQALLPDGDVVLAADRRFVEKDAPEAEVETIKSPRFYKTNSVRPRNVDLAYSEIILLDMKLD